jgi:hypothetical protein
MVPGDHDDPHSGGDAVRDRVPNAVPDRVLEGQQACGKRSPGGIHELSKGLRPLRVPQQSLGRTSAVELNDC